MKLRAELAAMKASNEQMLNRAQDPQVSEEERKLYRQMATDGADELEKRQKELDELETLEKKLNRGSDSGAGTRTPKDDEGNDAKPEDEKVTTRWKPLEDERGEILGHAIEGPSTPNYAKAMLEAEGSDWKNAVSENRGTQRFILRGELDRIVGPAANALTEEGEEKRITRAVDSSEIGLARPAVETVSIPRARRAALEVFRRVNVSSKLFSYRDQTSQFDATEVGVEGASLVEDDIAWVLRNAETQRVGIRSRVSNQALMSESALNGEIMVDMRDSVSDKIDNTLFNGATSGGVTVRGLFNQQAQLQSAGPLDLADPENLTNANLIALTEQLEAMLGQIEDNGLTDASHILMRSNYWRAIQTVKDSNQRPLRDIFSAGPGTIFGYPVLKSVRFPALPTAANQNRPWAVAGDFPGYSRLYVLGDVEVSASADARFEEDEMAFRGIVNMEVKLLRPTAFARAVIDHA